MWLVSMDTGPSELSVWWSHGTNLCLRICSTHPIWVFVNQGDFVILLLKTLQRFPITVRLKCNICLDNFVSTHFCLISYHSHLAPYNAHTTFFFFSFWNSPNPLQHDGFWKCHSLDQECPFPQCFHFICQLNSHLSFMPPLKCCFLRKPFLKYR